MLMTPITPKVMARPIAASSNTEPSDSPYQAFCTVFQIAKVRWILRPGGGDRGDALRAAGSPAGH